VTEFRRANLITLTEKQRRWAPCGSEGNIMNRNRSKLAAVALVAAMGLGLPALAKSTHSGGKGRQVAGHGPRSTPAQRAPLFDESVRRTPTFGAPNPNSPALTGGGSSGYNANLYVY
jgi:hypothetical protein